MKNVLRYGVGLFIIVLAILDAWLNLGVAKSVEFAALVSLSIIFKYWSTFVIAGIGILWIRFYDKI